MKLAARFTPVSSKWPSAKSQIPLRYLVADRLEAGRRPAASRNLANHLVFFFFSRLISAVADWMSTILAHNGVALVRI